MDCTGTANHKLLQLVMQLLVNGLSTYVHDTVVTWNSQVSSLSNLFFSSVSSLLVNSASRVDSLELTTALGLLNFDERRLPRDSELRRPTTSTTSTTQYCDDSWALLEPAISTYETFHSDKDLAAIGEAWQLSKGEVDEGEAWKKFRRSWALLEPVDGCHCDASWALLEPFNYV
jgi:hypothetical protein